MEINYENWKWKVKVLITPSYYTLSNPTDCSLPGSSVLEILQAKILEWVALPSPVYLPDAGIKPGSPALQADSLLSYQGSPKWKRNGILQAGIWEWVAIPFSRGSSQLRDQTWFSCIAGRSFTIWAATILSNAIIISVSSFNVRDGVCMCRRNVKS